MKLYKIEITPVDNGWIIKERRREKIEEDNDGDGYFDDYTYENNTKVFGTIDNAISFLDRKMNEN